MESPPRLRVTAQQIRQRFNEERYLQRLERGELEQVIRLEKPLSPATCQAKGYPWEHASNFSSTTTAFAQAVLFDIHGDSAAVAPL